MLPNIIPYTEAHKDATRRFILSILEDEFGYKGITRPDLDQIPTVYDAFWLALSNEEIVGTIALQNYGDGRGFLKRLYVKKELRHKGLGQELFNTLLKFAKSTGYQTLYTSTVDEFTAAQAFYKKNGFIKITQLPQDLQLPHETVFFELKLK